jgi:hypothetical protein
VKHLEIALEKIEIAREINLEIPFRETITCAVCGSEVRKIKPNQAFCGRKGLGNTRCSHYYQNLVHKVGRLQYEKRK